MKSNKRLLLGLFLACISISNGQDSVFVASLCQAQTYTQISDNVHTHSGVVFGEQNTNNYKNSLICKTIYHPVLTGDSCLWSVPRMSMAGCWLDTIWAIKGDTSGYSLIISNSAYNTYSEYGWLYASDDNEKLYFKNLETDSDLLVMDLSLSEGDSFVTKGIYEEDILMVVDSVFYENNKKHVQFDRVLWYSPPTGLPEKFCFIEGVGPNWGFSRAKENVPLLICKHEDGELYYSHPDTLLFKDCNFREPCWDAVSTYAPKHLNVFPNPATDKVVLESDCEIVHITVSDMFGNELQNMTLPTGQKRYVIDIAPYTRGLYIVQCLLDNKVFNTKIIKR